MPSSDEVVRPFYPRQPGRGRSPTLMASLVSDITQPASGRRCSRRPACSLTPSDDALIWHVVARLPDEEPTAEAVAAIARLFEIAATETTVDYYLGQTLANLDPHGRVGPQMVASRLADVLAVPDVGAVCEWARFAGWYAIGSKPWRTIASATCARVLNDATDDERDTVFAALHSHRMEEWHGAPGQLHERFEGAIVEARRLLKEEGDLGLRMYWQWEAKKAERTRDYEAGRLEERKRLE